MASYRISEGAKADLARIYRRGVREHGKAQADRYFDSLYSRRCQKPQNEQANMNFKQLAAELEAFADERDWGQFHSPKNLSMALIAEAAELVAHFQWLSETQSQDLDERTLAAVRNEIADVQIYLARLADRLGVDIESAVRDKLAENARKYPAERVRGSAKKYTEYPDETS